ncbi:MAG: hypothetical protein AAGN66_23630 [Acidobacteriota bacterium]
MVRSIASILAGMAVWAVLWVATNSIISVVSPESFAEDGSTDSIAILGLILVLSVVYSVLAGWLTARLARRRELLHAGILGAIQLAIGIAVQAQFWDVMPLWYHLSFLGFQLPAYLAGAKLFLRRRTPGSMD